MLKRNIAVVRRRVTVTTARGEEAGNLNLLSPEPSVESHASPPSDIHPEPLRGSFFELSVEPGPELPVINTS